MSEDPLVMEAPRMSWAPYGRVPAPGPRSVVVSMSPVTSERVSMAPLQLARRFEAGGAQGSRARATPRSAPRSPATQAAPRATPVPERYRAPAAPPRVGGAPGAPAAVSGADWAQQAERWVPGLEQTVQRWLPGAEQAVRRWAPEVEQRVRRRAPELVRRLDQAGPPPPGDRGAPGGPWRPPVQARPSGFTLPFDPLAVVAIVLAFLFPPLGVVVALISLNRARQNDVSPALSVIALLVAIGMNLVAFGGLAALGGLLQSG
ncbi:hypothetical protein Q6348_02265 [Isoptericola sp. b441]|uniref:DUF4190 domain-containing protein n=1 Tax=Actinotalea lenta TaxID=3064654 RepID=A0ABT9D9N0_9CELL|nr:hypothetical protein [Isoptericola sp. b441]MDO8106016.1 hypothetical protein [Isoptericola sp. b441]